MKYFFIVCLCSMLYACGGNDSTTPAAAVINSKPNNSNDTANYTAIEWIDPVHQDLGKVNQGQVVEVTWRFKNAGPKPLIITNASASCGCTVADKPEEPIAPGEEGVIKAKFDSHDRENMQNKQVYVEANTKGSRTHQLDFSIDVVKK